MVCSIGSGRMAVMARFLAAGNLSQNTAEEAGQHKLVAQFIYRELREADEPNLLDEEDMHVFGLNPMTDPLDLVCCNNCKKPVKASQYASHAELCRSLNSAKEVMLQLDGGKGHRKPPRKEKKKLLSAYNNQVTPVGVQERSGSIDAGNTATLESRLELGTPSSISVDTKRNSACTDVASVVAGEGLSQENTDSACAVRRPTKRIKLKSTRNLPPPFNPETTSGITKIASTEDPFSCRGIQMQPTSRIEMPNNFGVADKRPSQALVRHLMMKDIPAPLATKIYYSQKNNRLRSEVAHLYHVASTEKLYDDLTSAEVPQGCITSLHASSQSASSLEQVDELLGKKREPSATILDQIQAQNSHACLEKSRGCLSATNFADQLPVDNILGPQNATGGLLKSKYMSKPYSFAADSGQSLGAVQQVNGRVPVL